MLDLLKVRTIIEKEWAEVFKHRMVLFTVLFMPLLFTAIPLIFLSVTGVEGVGDLTSDMPSQFNSLCPSTLTSGECFQVYMARQFLLLFMLMPLIIPVNIAAYSIVGEKTTHSLEPLLATPITTIELIAGKNLAATIPAVLATWASFGLFAFGSWIIVENPNVTLAVLDTMWLFAILFIGPLLAILSVNFSLMVSSRVNDPRVAEQLSAVVILPVLAIFFGQIAGLFFINQYLILAASAAMVLLDAGMVYLAVRLFNRETILTKWK